MPPQDLAAGEPDPEALATQARAAALRSQAAAFRQQGRHPLAAARSRAANELLPDDPALLSELAGDLFNANEPEQAAEFFQRALHHEPDRPDALSGLALVEAARQRYPAALDHLRRLTERQPDDARAWLRYGDIAHKLGRTSEAVNAWRKAIEAASADQDTRTRARKRLDVLAPKPDGV
jgi:tetratricopeptide (TPR) repeat protein